MNEILTRVLELQSNGGDVRNFIESLPQEQQDALDTFIQAKTVMRNSVASTASSYNLDISHDVEAEEEHRKCFYYSKNVMAKFPPYAQEISDMVVAFGGAHPARNILVCTCSEKGKSPKCRCSKLVRWLQFTAKKYGTDIVRSVIRGEHSRSSFDLDDLKELLPCEMEEYTIWMEARKRAKVRERSEKNDPKDTDADDDSSLLSDVDSDDSSDSEEMDENAQNDKKRKGKNEAEPPAKLRRGDPGYSSDTEVNEYICDKSGLNCSAVRARMEARKSFADRRTSNMSGAKYNAFVRQRNAFFIGKCKSGPSGKKNKTSGLNSVDLKFMTWLGFSKARIKHLAVKAVAFLVYDRIGMIIERAILNRCKSVDNTLQELPIEKPLNLKELQIANVSFQNSSFSSASNAIWGLINKKYPSRYHYVGNPNDWPCSVVLDSNSAVHVKKGDKELTLLYMDIGSKADELCKVYDIKSQGN